MKKLIKTFICFLLLINIFSINNVINAEDTPYLTISTGEKYVVYTLDSSKAEVSVVEGNPIEGLQLTYEKQNINDFFVITPTKDLVLDDFSLNVDGNVEFVLEHDLTINGSIKQSSITPKKRNARSIPTVIYVKNIISFIGDHTFTANYTIDESIFEGELPSTKFYLSCIYADFFSFVGDDTGRPTININDCTDKATIKNKGFKTLGIPIASSPEVGTQLKSPYIKQATLNIKSYLYGIVSKQGIRVIDSTVNLLRMGLETENPSYAGIYCQTLGLSAYNNSKINIQEDENCGVYQNEAVYGIVSSKPSEVTFENCKLNFDLSKSNGQTFAIESSGYVSGPTSICFDNTYADLKGYLYIPELSLSFTGNSSVYFSSKTTPVMSELDTDSMISIDNKDYSPNVLFETTNSNYRWAQGFDNYYGVGDFFASEECLDWNTTYAFHSENTGDYRWVARRSKYLISYKDGYQSPFVAESFTKIPNPGVPAGHEGEEFLGWYYVDKYNDEVRFDFNDYVRCDMELYPKWKEKGIESFEIENLEYRYLFFGIDYDIDYEKYHSDYGYRIAFKDGNCLYYGDSSGMYDNKTGQYVDEEVPVFNSDTFVYKKIVNLNDTSKKFNDNTIVKVNGTPFPKLSENKIIEKESTGYFDDSYNGYLISEDGTSIMFQFVTAVPKPYYVNTLEIEHDGFDFENYDINLELPETHKLFSEKMITLVKDGQVKYSIYDEEGTRTVINAKGEMIGLLEDVTLDEIDSAVVAFVIEPVSFGPLFNESSKIVVNDIALKHTTDPSKFVGWEDGFEGKITSDVELCMVNEDACDELMVQLYFSLKKPSPKPKPTPYIIPSTGIK